jgi:AraC-like DNA-binding protein
MKQIAKVNRINFGAAPVPQFEELVEYNTEVCHLVWHRDFPIDEIVPLHYAKTLEVMICTNLIGEVVVDRNHYYDLNASVFTIPPNTVHSMHIKRCPGYLNTIIIPFEALEHFINIKNIVAYENCKIDFLPFLNPNYEDFLAISNDLFTYDDNIFMRMRIIIRMFELLENNYRKISGKQVGFGNLPNSNNAENNLFDVRRVIKWVSQNYQNQIHLEDIASETGYSKYYFCSRFKKLTGMTFLTYLNQVRVSQAKLLLHQDNSITNISLKCGFENTAYFSQMFKRYTGQTPREYRKAYQQSEK